jgi:putative two-component system response regulator
MNHSNLILIVDDEPNNLKLLQQILKPYYRLIFATNGEKALVAVKHHLPDLILLDVMMPDMSGYQVCEALKADADTRNIPVIFVSALGGVEDETRGFDVGAVDYIIKPVSAPVTLKRVETHLRMVHMQDLKELVSASIKMLGEAGHYNDTDTGEHIWRMADYTAVLARQIGWSEAQAKKLTLAAPMHDTGKIGIPDAILKAPRKLSLDEWRVMKKHCLMGHDILAKSDHPVFKLAAEVALAHHEKWDGSGYPSQLRGEDIPVSARIVAIADVFDALTMVRPYKKAWTSDQAFELIKSQSGKHFDPQLVEAFIACRTTILAIKDKWALGEVREIYD